MNEDRSIAEEVAARAKAYYDQHLCALVEPEHRGKFLVLKVESGSYEIDQDQVAAIKRAVTKDSDAHRFLFRVGCEAAHWTGIAQVPHASDYELYTPVSY